MCRSGVGPSWRGSRSVDSTPGWGMQPTLTTVAETADLFNLGPLIVVNLHCIPTDS